MSIKENEPKGNKNNKKLRLQQWQCRYQVGNHQCKVTDPGKEFQMANLIILGVVDHVVMPHKLPIATNCSVINRDNVTRTIL